jgi:hypothetical protein
MVPMRGQVNRIGLRSGCGFIGVSLLLWLGGCDWLFGSSTPANTATVRPGAERQIGPSNALPAVGGGHSYDAPATPIDETRSGPRIGSILPDKGGQKAQLEAVAKEQAERDKKAREEREKQAADRKEREAREAKDAPPKPPGPPSGTVTYPPDQNASSPAAQPPPAEGAPTQTQTAPPPAPVTTAPIAPPAAAPPTDQKS